jgi:hypothetical protein
MDPGYLRELVAYWRDQFDWRRIERELNALPQFTVDIDGQRVHFLHVRAGGSKQGSGSLPLILTHGWPSSFLEMLPLAVRLTERVDDSRDSFDVVIPSLPGFAFSDLPPIGPVTPEVVADLWARLMSNVLGYDRFGAYGGDVESRFSKDTLLTIVTLYWITGTIGSSFRSYFDDEQAEPLPLVGVPTGITLTPEDRDYPREYAERTYSDIRQWRGPAKAVTSSPSKNPTSSPRTSGPSSDPCVTTDQRTFERALLPRRFNTSCRRRCYLQV